MSKLVICCDGTGNNAVPSGIQTLQPTTVLQLYNALTASTSIQAYYQPCASAGSLLSAIASNTQLDMQGDALACYQWLIDHYTPGDEIYLFGFDLGAWTIRTIAALISHYGIPRTNEQTSQTLALQVYQNGYRKAVAASSLPVHFHPHSNQIRFCCLWEQNNTALPSSQEPLTHLLQTPERYDVQPATPTGGPVFITPAHTAFVPAQQPADAAYTPEQLLEACTAAGLTLPAPPQHCTDVATAISAATPVLDSPQPLKTTVQARKPWNWTGIYLEAGQRYRFSARGHWQGAALCCGPDGAGNAQERKLTTTDTASLLTRVGQRWRRFTGEDSIVPAPSARRVECANWFALIGVIATDGDTLANTTATTPFEIGKGCELECHNSGYLYCFANDVWGLYDDNQGEIQLSIERM